MLVLRAFAAERGLETRSPEYYLLFLLPLPPKFPLSRFLALSLVYILLPVKILEACSGKRDTSSRMNSPVCTHIPESRIGTLLMHWSVCIAVAIYWGNAQMLNWQREHKPNLLSVGFTSLTSF